MNAIDLIAFFIAVETIAYKWIALFCSLAFLNHNSIVCHLNTLNCLERSSIFMCDRNEKIFISIAKR